MQAASTWKRFATICIAVALSVSFAPDSTYAQVLYGSLTGNVTDASGAAVPDAKVEASNVATGVTRQVSTDDRGVYLFNDLQTGIYKVTLSAPSFRTVVQEGVNIKANTVLRRQHGQKPDARSRTGEPGRKCIPRFQALRGLDDAVPRRGF